MGFAVATFSALLALFGPKALLLWQGADLDHNFNLVRKQIADTNVEPSTTNRSDIRSTTCSEGIIKKKIIAKLSNAPDKSRQSNSIAVGSVSSNINTQVQGPVKLPYMSVRGSCFESIPENDSPDRIVLDRNNTFRATSMDIGGVLDTEHKHMDENGHNQFQQIRQSRSGRFIKDSSHHLATLKSMGSSKNLDVDDTSSPSYSQKLRTSTRNSIESNSNNISNSNSSTKVIKMKVEKGLEILDKVYSYTDSCEFISAVAVVFKLSTGDQQSQCSNFYFLTCNLVILSRTYGRDIMLLMLF
eukprot:gene15353-32502_t